MVNKEVDLVDLIFQIFLVVVMVQVVIMVDLNFILVEVEVIVDLVGLKIWVHFLEVVVEDKEEVVKEDEIKDLNKKMIQLKIKK